MGTKALVLFTDIRGFTKWSDSTEVSAALDEFVDGFLNLVQRAFPQANLIKGLGDGAMVVQESTDPSPEWSALLDLTLQRVAEVEAGFEKHCAKFSADIGHAAPLKLGWSVVRGDVRKLSRQGPNGTTEVDYVGSNLNKCARLCDAARPFGIVIDAMDFPNDPSKGGSPRFHAQTRRLSGLSDEVPVWVTDEIQSQFVPRERLRQTPEVHVAGLCVDANDRRGLRILLARRSAERRLFPNKLEGCGGQLAYSESFVDGVKRHFKLEMGIEVRVLDNLHSFYTIREPEQPIIPGIRFLCEQVDQRQPASKNHASVTWMSEREFRNTPDDEFIAGLKEEVIRLIGQYRSGKKSPTKKPRTSS